MKRLISLILGVAAVSLTLVACNKKDDDASIPNPCAGRTQTWKVYTNTNSAIDFSWSVSGGSLNLQADYDGSGGFNQRAITFALDTVILTGDVSFSVDVNGFNSSDNSIYSIYVDLDFVKVDDSEHYYAYYYFSPGSDTSLYVNNGSGDSPGVSVAGLSTMTLSYDISGTTLTVSGPLSESLQNTSFTPSGDYAVLISVYAGFSGTTEGSYSVSFSNFQVSGNGLPIASDDFTCSSTVPDDSGPTDLLPSWFPI